ncbi:MFS transporter [Micrococcoides hystricis]|uniref:MFS transporter n=1 Tax=Micrococcoides hystricis TaxID=1572761 RepID=A0ABV6P8T1_9MICC
MTSTVQVSHHGSGQVSQRRVAFATLVGTTIEWYDFFIFAQAAALVFSELFYKPAGPQISLLLSFATVGVSFLFRPLGAFLAGHYGDKLGRRLMLVITLVVMGGATTLIGLLPTYATAGVLAPILLLVLRILQGISAGGEWGGAVLMAVEHAPGERRGRAGAVPQLGVPLGMLLASGVMALMTGVISPGDAFMEWGWRVPFLLSIVLIVLGYFIRRAVDESPVFQEIADRKEQISAPTAVLFKRHWYVVILAALIFAGNGASGYMITGGYLTNYTTQPDGLNMDRTAVLIVISAAAFGWLVSTFVAGILADKIGRRNTYLLGWVLLGAMSFPLFAMVNTGRIEMLLIAGLLFSVGLGLTYGPQAAWYSEIFPADVRFSGVSVSYAIGAILGGAFAPTIATWLVQQTGGTTAVSIYLLSMVIVGAVATLLLRDRQGINLSIKNVDEQRQNITTFN